MFEKIQNPGYVVYT